LADPRLRLLDAVEREDSEGDGNARLERRELQAARGLARDVVEMRRVAADDAAERDDAGEATRLRERRRGERQLECAGYDHDRDRLLPHAGVPELGERAVEQLCRDLSVESRHD